MRVRQDGLYVSKKKKEEGKIYGRTEYLIDYYYWMYHYVRVFLGDGDGIFLAEPDSDQEYGGKGK